MKNSKIKNRLNKVVVLLFLFATTLIQAQPGFGDDVEDVPAAPIDSKLVYLIGFGIVFALYVVRYNQKQIRK